jgi:glycosyltransferase involved in cell wall biosynthesis
VSDRESLRRETQLLRVFVVIPGPMQGFSMIFAKRQAAALARQGHSVHVFYLAARTHPRHVWREWRRMRGELATFSPDVLLASYGTVTAMLAALATTRPLVVTYRGSDLNPGTRSWTLSTLSRLMSQVAALRAAGIICVSAELRRRLWWRRGRAVVIPTGVDTRVFGPMERSAARRELAWDDRPVILFYAGEDPGGKRLDVAEATLAEVQRGLPDARLEVLWGRELPDRVPLYMNAADCLLLTSDSEGSPTIVQEALACKLPVVAVPVGDVVERLTGIEPSAIVARDPRALAAALVPILRDRRRTSGAAGAQECDADVVLGRVLDVLRHAAAAS